MNGWATVALATLPAVVAAGIPLVADATRARRQQRSQRQDDLRRVIAAMINDAAGLVMDVGVYGTQPGRRQARRRGAEIDDRYEQRLRDRQASLIASKVSFDLLVDHRKRPELYAAVDGLLEWAKGFVAMATGPTVPTEQQLEAAGDRLRDCRITLLDAVQDDIPPAIG